MIILQIVLDPLDYFSLISSITSIILGIVAITLSILFYRMSEKIGRENERTSASIESNVTKLEELFNKLYTGTFDMMKETVTDMRKHVYKSDGNNKTIPAEDKIIKATIDSMSDEIDNLKTSNIGEAKIKTLIEDALLKSRKIKSDLNSNDLKLEIIAFLSKREFSTYPVLRDHLIKTGLITRKDSNLFNELMNLSTEKIINDPFDHGGIDSSLSHNAKIYIL